jgi:hypothetical protein
MNHTKTDNIDTATIEQTTPAMIGALLVLVSLFEIDDWEAVGDPRTDEAVPDPAIATFPIIAAGVVTAGDDVLAEEAAVAFGADPSVLKVIVVVGAFGFPSGQPASSQTFDAEQQPVNPLLAQT